MKLNQLTILNSVILTLSFFFFTGCVTTRPQQKDTFLDEINQLSLKVHSLEQENRTLQQENGENERTVAQLEDNIANLKVEQTAQIKPNLPAQFTKTNSRPLKRTNKNIQRALKTAGYDIGTVDGKIGPRTRSAIVAFQKTNGLNADGTVGVNTWAKLQTYLAKTDK